MASGANPTHRGEHLGALITLTLILLATGWLWLGPGKFSTELSAFMPSVNGEEEDTPAALLEMAMDPSLILAAISGGDSAQRADASRTLTEQLVEHPLIRQGHNGSAPEAPGTPEQLFEYRYLLAPDTHSAKLHHAQLQQGLTDIRRQLATPGGALSPEMLLRDPTGAWADLLNRWISRHDLQREHGVWTTEDGERALLLLETDLEANDTEAQDRLVTTIRDTFNQEVSNQELGLLLTGQAVFASESSRLIRAEIKRLSIGASLLVALILLMAFRSLTAVLLAGIPLLAGVLAGAALVTAIFGSLHGIALAFGIILIGVALDYPLHLIAHQRSGTNSWDTARRLSTTLRLGAASTAIAFGAMALADIPGLAQMGVFAAGGLLMALLTTHYLLPWFLQRQDANRLQPTRAPLPDAPPVLGPVLAATLIFGSGLVIALNTTTLWQEDVTELNPVPEKLREADARLRADLGGHDLRYLVLVRGETVQEALEHSHSLADQMAALHREGVVQSTDHPALWLPPKSLQRERQEQLPDRESLSARVIAEAEKQGFRAESLEPFLEDVSRSATLPPLGPGNIDTDWLESRLNRLLVEGQNAWFAIFRLNGVSDHARLTSWFDTEAPSHANLIDTTARSAAQLAEFRSQTLWRFSLGTVLMFLLLCLGLRSVGGAIRVITPPLAGSILAAGFLITLGQTLTLFHLVSLLLVVGIGLDYALFFHRHRHDDCEAARTQGALLLCFMSTVSVFGALALSEIPVLAHIGMTVVPGTVAALMLAWLTARPRNVYDLASRR